MADNRYLERRGNVWWVVVYVPRPLVPRLGKKLTRTLGTDSLTQARRDRWPHVAAYQATINAAQAETSRQTSGDLAADLREALRTARHHGNADPRRDEPMTPLDHAEAALDAITDEIAQRDGEAAAARFYAVASGQATPIPAYVDRWLAAVPFTVRTQAEHRTAIRRLLEWTRGQDIPATLEDFSGKHASAFRDLGLLAASGLHSKTANKIMSSLRSYWAWAISSELVGGENPWTRKSLGVRRASISADERPFTHDELRTLLRGVEDRDLQDFMRIAALTGMRIEEIASLTVAQCRGGLFRVGDAKTESGAGRVIPVHPDLEEVVERRSAGKSEAAFLLMEQSGAGWDGNRSMAISKRFTRARRRLGVDERRVGQRRALINFHSFRRWFIQAAIDQGSPDPWLLADIVGHKAGELPFDLTMRKYPGKSRIDRRRALIEAIRLPD